MPLLGPVLERSPNGLAGRPLTQLLHRFRGDAAAAAWTGDLAARYLGGAKSAVYLLRPDQHVAARWPSYDEAAVKAALRTATGRA